MYQVDHRRLNQIGFLVATIFSSVIPLVSIIALYFVKNTLKRIGIAAAFTALFAVAVSVFTTARRIEIFAGTAT